MTVEVEQEHTERAPAEDPGGGAVPHRALWRRFLRDRLSMLGLVIVVALVLAAIFAPELSPQPPNEQDVLNSLAGPSAEHPLGTDHLGRDNLSRLLHGARWSLGVTIVATVFITLIGATLGLLAGYVGRWTDAVVMRGVDVLLALPTLVLVIAIIGTLGTSTPMLLFAIVVSSWTLYARVMRGLVLSMRERQFVLSARVAGASHVRIMFRHILPNTVSPVVVLASLQMGSLILMLAGLGFLGFGVQPPTPEWGTMLNEARVHFRSDPQQMLYPGVAITLAVLGFNLLGDGLRDVLDPRMTL